MNQKSPLHIKEAAYEKANAMKDAKGEPTKKAMALKKWGFGSVAAAKSFCSKHKSKK